MMMLLSLLNQAYDFNRLLSELLKVNLSISDPLKLLDADTAQKFSEGKIHQILFHEEMAWQNQFEYIKIFDETLSDDDPDNYYMEREWRCTHNIKFKLSDIQKIYLKNKKYKDKFAEYFPEYRGEFYIFESE